MTDAGGASRRVPLLWRLFAANATVFLVGLLVLTVSPVTVSHPVQTVEIAVIVVGVAALLAVSWWATRRVLEPIEGLRRAINALDGPEGGRVTVSAAPPRGRGPRPGLQRHARPARPRAAGGGAGVDHRAGVGAGPRGA